MNLTPVREWCFINIRTVYYQDYSSLSACHRTAHFTDGHTARNKSLRTYHSAGLSDCGQKRWTCWRMLRQCVWHRLASTLCQIISTACINRLKNGSFRWTGGTGTQHYYLHLCTCDDVCRFHTLWCACVCVCVHVCVCKCVHVCVCKCVLACECACMRVCAHKWLAFCKSCESSKVAPSFLHHMTVTEPVSW